MRAIIFGRVGLREQAAALAGLLVLSLVSATCAEAQVKVLSVQPGTPIPSIEVVNDGKTYTGIETSNLNFPVQISAQCESRSELEDFYLITNSSQPDFDNERIAGTVGAGELGFMLVFRAKNQAESLPSTKWDFSVPVNEIFSGEQPVPLQICNELMRRKIKDGENKTSILAKDWKIIQPLTISFMPGCVTRKGKNFSQEIKYWSKQSTTQLVNYICKASKVAIAANAKSGASTAGPRPVVKKTAPKPEPLKKTTASTEKSPAKVTVATRVAEKPAIKPAPAPKAEPKPEPRAEPKPEPTPAPVVAEAEQADMIADVSVVAEPREYSGECPALIAFKGEITAAQKGMVRFHFEDNGRAEATRAVMFKNKNDTHRFHTQALFDKSRTGSVKLVVEGPGKRQVESGYKVVCKN